VLQLIPKPLHIASQCLAHAERKALISWLNLVTLNHFAYQDFPICFIKQKAGSHILTIIQCENLSVLWAGKLLKLFYAFHSDICINQLCIKYIIRNVIIADCMAITLILHTDHQLHLMLYMWQLLSQWSI